MDPMHVVLLALFLLAGVLAAWLATRLAAYRVQSANAEARASRAESDTLRFSNDLTTRDQRVSQLDQQARALDLKRVELEAELENVAKAHADEIRRYTEVHHEQLKSFEQRERDFKDNVAKRDTEIETKFRSLATQALTASSEQFLKLASQNFAAAQQQGLTEIDKRKDAVDRLVLPIGETLKKTQDTLASFEKGWATDRGTLNEQLKAVGISSEALRTETGKLVKALREPHVRGRYGEIQLKKVAELSGMAAYCDFATQDSARDGEGVLLRPDMIVRMPNGRSVVIDAKTNIQAYLDAQHAATPEDAEIQLDRFARHVADQASALSKKKYWSQFEGSPEFTVMFLPHDAFLDAALARRPDLIEQAWGNSIIFATPSSLIALLRAVHVGYQEQRVADQAKELFALGKELHQRAAIAFGKVQEVGEAIVKASDKYNEFVSSYTKRLEPTLVKFENAGVKSDKQLPEIEPLAIETKRLPGPEAAVPK